MASQIHAGWRVHETLKKIYKISEILSSGIVRDVEKTLLSEFCEKVSFMVGLGRF
jgi:hypothetical protein